MMPEKHVLPQRPEAYGQKYRLLTASMYSPHVANLTPGSVNPNLAQLHLLLSRDDDKHDDTTLTVTGVPRAAFGVKLDKSL
jgi:hypothetical protein